ncbi:MAG: hypothetical protein A2Z01_06975 [Betaproteobacteria bacterium RBG_16_58_11]|nr:MAG: hypothetical protein A2Z01_06975 [Betaproteobacteria bacterium RBG_16_58_11]
MNELLKNLRLPWLLLLLVLQAWPSLGAAAPRQVVVVLSDASAPYQEAARTIREGLEGESAKLAIRVVVVGGAGADEAMAQPDSLLVPLGAKAAQLAAKSNQPIFAALVARQSFEKLFPSTRHSISAIYLDQPISRHLQLVRVAQPRARSVGVVLGPTQSVSQAELANAASSAGLRLSAVALSGDGDLFSSLQTLLPNVDALLLFPDPLVVNRSSLQNLMLTTYRQRVPVVGYSQNLVDAGALVAVYSTPQQIGQQVAESIQRMLSARHWELPPPAYPKYFTIKTNSSVARSLDIEVPSEAVLAQRMGAGAGL